jgi:hypothetical protein
LVREVRQQQQAGEGYHIGEVWAAISESLAGRVLWRGYLSLEELQVGFLAQMRLREWLEKRVG